jgi:hypothetical protein
VAKELNPSCSGEISAKERNQDTPDSSDHKRRVLISSVLIQVSIR